MATSLAIVGLLFLWRGSDIWPYWFYVSGLLIFTGIAFPIILMPLEWIWMKLASVLGFIMTHILLTLFFYLVMTPIGIILRIVGKDTLKLKSSKNSDTYWVPVDVEGSVNRPDKPY